MNRRGGFLPIAVAAIGAVIYSFVPGRGSGAGASPDSSAASRPAMGQAAASSLPSEDPLRILDEFLDARSGKGLDPSWEGDANLIERTYRVAFLIATVPDPIDSHLIQNFDRAVDAIQRGMEQNGYVLDRHFLPWKREAGNSSEPGDSAAVGPRGGGGDLYRRVPGALLFRGARMRRKLVIVYLVGETPTSGIQREAMSRALDAVAMCGLANRPGLSGCENSEIRLLAPFFSGSTDSLRNCLRAWNTGSTFWGWKRAWNKRLRIISGAATVESNARQLGERLPLADFKATVVPDEIMRATFFHFLHEHVEHPHASEVALFVEGGTGYGSAVVRPEAASGAAPMPSPGPSRAAHDESHAENPVAFTIPFPLHVSQLRGEYEKDTTLKSTGLFNRGPRHSLELPLEAPEKNPKDVLPVQDPRMTAAVADLVLANGIETIRREKIHFVGIVASDTRDILFLARKIRESQANVTLFTFGADVLFAHPDYERYLRGMLVVTSYPLFQPNQQWTGAGPRRLAFSGSSDQGIYNAVLSLVPEDTGKMSSLLEYHSPLSPGPERPPVWVMAVGRHGFWPIWFTQDYEDRSRYVYSPPSTVAATGVEAPRERPPGVSLFFVLLEVFFVLVLASYGGVRLRVFTKSQRISERMGMLARVFGGINRHADILFSNWSNRSARGIHQVYLGTVFFVFGLVQTAVCVVLFATRSFIPGSLALLVFTLLLAAGFWAAAGREYVVHYREGRSKVRLALVLGVSLALAVPAALYLYGIAAMDRADVLAFYGRVLDFASTLTPALPLLLCLAVVCFWAITNIQRAFLLEIHGEGRPPGEGALQSLEGLRPLQASMERLLDDPATRAIALLGPILLLIPFYRVLSWHEYHTIDGVRWSVLFEVILLVCYFVIVYSVTLFLLLCLGLRRVLKRLACHPVATAFQRLPDSVATSPWKMWSALPSLAVQAASVAQLRALVNIGRGEADDPTQRNLSTLADLADQQMAKALRSDAIGLTATLPFRRALRRLLGSATVTVLAALEQAWNRWPRSAGAVELPEKAQEPQVLNTPAWIRTRTPAGPEIWIRTAEEFVALRMSVFIRHVFLQMRNLLSFSFVGFLLALSAINSYPFEPKRLVMALIWFVALVTIPTVAWVFVKMDRDPILSFIGKTKPGRVTLSMELVTSMLIYVVVPLVTLFATQFPEVGDVIFSIFNPTVKSLGK